MLLLQAHCSGVRVYWRERGNEGQSGGRETSDCERGWAKKKEVLCEWRRRGQSTKHSLFRCPPFPSDRAFAAFCVFYFLFVLSNARKLILLCLFYFLILKIMIV